MVLTTKTWSPYQCSSHIYAAEPPQINKTAPLQPYGLGLWLSTYTTADDIIPNIVMVQDNKYGLIKHVNHKALHFLSLMTRKSL